MSTTCYEKKLCSTERRRCRHCRGCIYFDVVSTCGCCNYYLLTGKRRPSKFAAPDCKARTYKPGYVVPEYHIRYCQRVDEEEAIKQQNGVGKKSPKHLNSLEQCEEAHREALKRPGRKPTWDVGYGLWLYRLGYYYFEIADIVNTTQDKIAAYASDHHWADLIPPDVERERHDIEQAKREYQEYRARQNGQKEV